MAFEKKLTIGFIGAGNVAYHLSMAFIKQGHKIGQVISNNPLSANRLAELTGANDSDRIADLDTGMDILFLTIPDDSLVEVFQDVSDFHNLVVHTCGTCPLGIISCRRDPYGVFYPLMTFSPGREIPWGQVPIIIEASDSHSLSLLRNLAGELTSKVVELDSQRRQRVHLSAVWANNFANHILTRAFEIADHFEIQRELLYPLIRETFEKALSKGAFESQTGPALRHDKRSLRKHHELLNFDTQLQSIYDQLTESIQSLHQKKG